LGVGKLQPNASGPARYYLYQKIDGIWTPYNDYTDLVNVPAYLPDPLPGWVMPLSGGASVYDFKNDDGHSHLGLWIDRAASAVGR
jgi:hypothetical protein